MNIIGSISLFVLLNSVITSEAGTLRYKMELLQVLFRHGDRVPAKEEVYQTDPYDPVFYKAYGGYGQLTKLGMLREYQLGQMLRNVYNNFLGDYKPDEVYGFSTNVDRTKASLQLALAGLYPVTEDRQWNSFVNWTPIPTHYMISGSYLETNRFSPCAENGQLVKAVLESDKFVRKLEKYREFTEYVSNNTLFATSDPYNLYTLFWNVRCLVGMGLPLPNWCSNQCYSNLEDIAGIVLEAMTYTVQLKRLNTGRMLNRFLGNIVADDSKKVYMFSAHDTTVSAFTRALNLTAAPRIPDFGSAVIIEKLRGLMDNQIYIRLKMWTGVSEDLYVMQLDGCSEICPLTKFLKIIDPVMLTEDEKQCFSANKDYTETGNELLSNDENNTGVHKYYALAGNDIMSLKYSETFF